MIVALVITTYNSPNFLNHVLASVAEQSTLPDEVIVCDDGSSSETANLVRLWQSKLALRHVWQPDNGFRAARSRNLGFLKSRSEYIICIDGDCLLPPNFIKCHLDLAGPRILVAGGRCLLSPQHTQSVLWSKRNFSDIYNHWKFLRLPLGHFRDFRPRRWQSVRTCNIGFYRVDASDIGGFDELFIGWGREDSDFVVRMLNNAVKIRSGRLAACVAHLHHDLNPRTGLSVNEERFQHSLVNVEHVLSKSSVLLQA